MTDLLNASLTKALRALVLVSMAVISASAGATLRPTPCVHQVPSVRQVKQVGARCLVAAVAAAAGQHPPIVQEDLARQVPLFPTGASLFDMQNALTGLGYASLAFKADTLLVAGIVAAGRPVVAMVRRGGGKHAVVVRGVRWPNGDGRCGALPVAFQLMDPAHGTNRWMAADKFRSRQDAEQVLMFAPSAPTLRADLGAANWDRAAAQNARFRAQALLRRALAHQPLNRQSLALAGRAVREDPCWVDARTFHDDLAARLGEPPTGAQLDLAECGKR